MEMAGPQKATDSVCLASWTHLWEGVSLPPPTRTLVKSGSPGRGDDARGSQERGTRSGRGLAQVAQVIRKMRADESELQEKGLRTEKVKNRRQKPGRARMAIVEQLVRRDLPWSLPHSSHPFGILPFCELPQTVMKRLYQRNGAAMTIRAWNTLQRLNSKAPWRPARDVEHALLPTFVPSRLLQDIKSIQKKFVVHILIFNMCLISWEQQQKGPVWSQGQEK
uniref:Uncharacterized protein LOC123616983 isoform X2 n=1 Tax=Camelus bactrianus TaxID=9837 RepID=A0A9W3G620_CAMBA|nr:uncharacterized protein LOC123616983 isoform X2 [Camelus bactrianus]